MPIMDGITATRHIRSMPGFAELPILALTAHALPTEQEKSRAAGMTDHVTKPIDPDALYAALARAVKRTVPIPGARPLDALVPIEGGSARGMSVPGIDTERGLQRVAGNRDLYLRLLRRFALRGRSLSADFDAACAVGDLSAAHRMMHDVKGTAGTIGARAVQARAADLERELAERLAVAPDDTALPPGVRQTYDALIEQVVMVCDHIEAHQHRLATATPIRLAPPPSTAEHRALLRDAETLLKSLDIRATEHLDLIAAGDGPDADRARAASSAARDWDFEGARQHLYGPEDG